jgi:hypothetical protein
MEKYSSRLKINKFKKLKKNPSETNPSKERKKERPIDFILFLNCLSKD